MRQHRMNGLHRHRLGSRPRDEGSISLYFAIIATAALVMAGLVVDGGTALAARGRAADLATQAARAGADALAPPAVREQPDTIRLDPTAATRAAQAVLAAGGATGEVSVDGASVTVTAHLQRHTSILSAVGLTDISQSASATAQPIYGGPTQEGG